MRDHCAQCLSELPDRLGYSTPTDEVLCGPCYFALWGPKGHRELTKRSEERRPESRRPRPGKPIWLPGPSGELDPRGKRP